MVVGAGTVLIEDQVHAVKDAGVAFALAPGTDDIVLHEAHGVGLQFVPDGITPENISNDPGLIEAK